MTLIGFLASPLALTMGEIFHHWLRTGDIYPSFGVSSLDSEMPTVAYQTPWEFVAYNSTHWPGEENITFAEFLEHCRSNEHGRTVNFRAEAEAMLAEFVPRLVFEAQALMHMRGGYSALQTHVQAEWLDDEERGEQYLMWLFEEMMKELGDRPVHTLFRRDNAATGFYMWSPEFSSATVKDAAASALQTDAGVVHLHLDEDFDQSEREWTAFLFPLNAGGQPAAVACGMIYSSSTCADLVIDADGESDGDAWMATKFVDTYPDAQARLEAGPIAFLTIWERRADAPAGGGRAVLQGALSHLQCHVEGLATLVVCLRPLQLVDELSNEPAPIATARLDALDAIRDLCEAVVAGTGLELRYITPVADEQTPWVAAQPPLSQVEPLLEP
jgi:hypothetical protein